MVVVANSFSSESARKIAIKDTLDHIVDEQLNWGDPQGRFGIKLDAINSFDAPFFVASSGQEGDASFQAALSYTHIATSYLDEVKLSSCVFFTHFYSYGP